MKIRRYSSAEFSGFEPSKNVRNPGIAHSDDPGIPEILGREGGPSPGLSCPEVTGRAGPSLRPRAVPSVTEDRIRDPHVTEAMALTRNDGPTPPVTLRPEGPGKKRRVALEHPTSVGPN
jgi:hypothetical protein